MQEQPKNFYWKQKSSDKGTTESLQKKQNLTLTRITEVEWYELQLN